jgi:predicted transcriptional regulator
MENNLLTPLELKVMNILWRLRKAFVKDIVEAWPEEEAKPAYNTVSTILRILEDPAKNKNFVTHKAFGRSHQYFPLVTKSQYQKRHIKSVLNDVFAGSMKGMVSTLLDENKISAEELDSLKKLIEDSEVQ